MRLEVNIIDEYEKYLFRVNRLVATREVSLFKISSGKGAFGAV